MYSLKSKWLGGVLLTSIASAAWGADLPTKKDAAPPGAAGRASCVSPQDFFTTDCALSYWGVTFYGAIDAGVGWESHGVPLNRNIISGVEELVQKNSNRPMWLATPGGLSQSFIGVKAKEEFAPNWNFIADLSFGFDPYTLSAANGPMSFMDNYGRPLANQTSNADSSRAGQFYNGMGFVGVSNPTFGTLTVGRQNSLSLDGVIEYDPMGAAYAFSVIGWSGLAAGGGDTEDARVTSAVKYRNMIGNIRVAALAQIGGYDFNNGAQAVYEGQLGGDFSLGAYGGLSIDGILSFDKGAVASGISKLPNTIAATISDDRSLMLVGKWSYERFKLLGGYELIQFQNPSNPQLSNFTDISGVNVIYNGVGGNINNVAYNNTRTQQVFWIGGRYKISDTLDSGLAYYHYYQSSFAKVACSNSSSPACAGTLDAVSFDLDWQFAKKFDTYAGVMFSQVNNGLSSGYLHTQNLAPTAGLRMRF
ncbi:MAG: porin [Pseudomonadota bacterium]|nr:porin [Pseudomonadota bacterium]